MLKFSKILVCGLLLLGCGSIWAADFVIIANPSVPVTSISRDDLSDIYLLRTNLWDDGTRVIPINRESGSTARAEFSARILKQSQSSLNTYWDKMHFQGVSPPLVQESDQAVLAFVQRVPGAIGYVSASLPLKNVKVLAEVQ
jgi:ABC-type phosphate transport system substrate-binding protein